MSRWEASPWEASPRDDQVPADLVQQQRPPSGRRWALAAAVVLTLLGGWRLHQVGLGDSSTAEVRTHRPPPDVPVVNETTAPRLVAVPAGSSAVGNGVLMLTIPSDWTRNATRCDRPAALSVSYGAEAKNAGSAAINDPTASCADGSGGPASSTVTFSTYDIQPARVLTTALPVAKIADKTLLGSSLTRSRGAYRRVLVMPADHLVVLVRSPSRRVVNTISRSAAEVPRGYRAVPECVGLPAGTAEATLAASGFLAQMFSDPGGGGTVSLHVVTQAPSMGVISPTGSVVALGLLPE